MTAEAVLRVTVAAVLAVSCAGKAFGNRTAIAAAWRLLGLLRASPRLVALVAGLESLAAAMMLGPWHRAGAALSVGLVLAFVSVVANALAHGRRPSCGCFGDLLPARVSVRLLAFDLALLSASVHVLGAGWILATGWGGAMVLLVIALVLGGALQSARVALSPPTAVGMPLGTVVPAVPVTTQDGQGADLRDLADRGILLLFVDDACAECRRLLDGLPVPLPRQVLVVGPGRIEQEGIAGARVDPRRITDRHSAQALRRALGVRSSPTVVRLDGGRLSATARAATGADLERLLTPVR